MRYFYLKANNAVQEYKTVIAGGGKSLAGAESFLADFLRFTDSDPTMVVSLHSSHPREEKLDADHLTIISFPRESLAGFLSGKKILGLVQQMFTGLKVLVMMLKFRPERVVCWSRSFPNWACFLGSKITGAVFVVSKHVRFAGPDDSFFARLISKMDMHVTCKAHRVLVHGPYLRDEVLSVGLDPGKVIMFDCVYDSAEFKNHYLNGDHDFSGNGQCLSGNGEILFVGRIENSKGIFELLESCRSILEEENCFKLRYAGNGSGLTKLRERVARYGLNSKVDILGRVEHHELLRLISWARCVITPTRSSFPEGRCMAAMEGLLMGRPVIAPDFGPFPYLIKDGVNGLLFVPDSVESLGQKVALIMKDNELYQRLQQGALETAKKLLTNKTGYHAALKMAFSYFPEYNYDN